MQIFLHTILFGENLISLVKNLYTSACLDFDHGLTHKVTKNVKVAKMAGFIKLFTKTLDQYPDNLTTGHF